MRGSQLYRSYKGGWPQPKYRPDDRHESTRETKNGANFHSRHDESATDITVAATKVYVRLDSIRVNRPSNFHLMESFSR